MQFPDLCEDLPRPLSRNITSSVEMEDVDEAQQWRDALQKFAGKEASVLAEDKCVALLRGVDCEMVLTDKGDELARIAVVDAAGRSLTCKKTLVPLIKPYSSLR